MEPTIKIVKRFSIYVNQYDGVNIAIKNAKRRMDGFREGKDVPSEYDPGTTVYKVVEELMGYLEE